MMAPPATTSSTKAQLLDVAEELFLAKGLGVSVRDVTEAAGQNGAAIHYHFGSPDGLLGAGVARRAGAPRAPRPPRRPPARRPRRAARRRRAADRARRRRRPRVRVRGARRGG